MKFQTLQKVICVSLMSGAFLFNSAAEAAVVRDKLPLLGYFEQTANYYNAPSGKVLGTVAGATALIQITSVRDDGWAYGTYPVNGNRRAKGWFRMADLQSDIKFANRTARVVRGAPVYRTSTGRVGNGSVATGTDVLVIAEKGNLAQIIYKQRNSSNWRLGWVSKVAFRKVQTQTTPNPSVQDKTTSGIEQSNQNNEETKKPTADNNDTGKLILEDSPIAMRQAGGLVDGVKTAVEAATNANKTALTPRQPVLAP